MYRLFLIVILFLSASAPHGLAQVRQEPLDQVLRSDPQEARQSVDDHTQGVTQRRSDAQVRTGTHDSRVELAEPPWEYTSPEDADILEGWESRFPAAAAKSPSEAGGSEPSALAQAWQLYRRGNYAAASKAFATLTASDNRQEALNARLGLAYSLIKQGRLDQAISHLTHLVDQGYRPSETRLALTHALMQSGRWSEARAQIAQLPPEKRAIWEKRLLEARLLKEVPVPGPGSRPAGVISLPGRPCQSTRRVCPAGRFSRHRQTARRGRRLAAGNRAATQAPELPAAPGPAPGDPRRTDKLPSGRGSPVAAPKRKTRAAAGRADVCRRTRRPRIADPEAPDG